TTTSTAPAARSTTGIQGRKRRKAARNAPRATEESTKGSASPAEYAERSATPVDTVSAVPASERIEPRIGPTHGVQPMANVTPTSHDPTSPAGFERSWSCW